MKTYDVVVVGAGPGGSIAAKAAAEGGLDVLVLERGAKPGEKNVSGTGLSPKCWRDLDFMKGMELPHMRLADQATIHLVDARNRELFNLTFSVSENAPYEEARRFLTMNVYRSELDPWLAGLATAAGAEVRTNVRVRAVSRGKGGAVDGVVIEDGSTIGAKVVVGADGIVSTVAETSGLRDRWGRDEVALIVQYDYGAPRERIDQAIGGNALHYWYGATFPVGYTFFAAHGFHAGLGTLMSGWEKGPHAYLDRFFEVEGVRRQIGVTGGERREFQAHLLPMLATPPPTVRDGVVLVGDAAGFACPLEAEGVYYAMLSGKFAGETIVDAVRRGDVTAAGLAPYEKRWHASGIGEEFEIGPEFAHFVKTVGFSTKPGAWIVPLLNDLAFGLFNVADAHVTNFRGAADRLLPYLPQLLETIEDVFLPIATAAERPRALPLPRPLRPAAEWLGRLLLRPAARLLGASKRSLPAEVAPLVLKHFARPYVDERRRTAERARKG